MASFKVLEAPMYLAFTVEKVTSSCLQARQVIEPLASMNT